MTAEPDPLHLPLAAPEPERPAPDLARLRGECPVAPVVLPSGDRAWLVTGYDDNRTVLSDPRFSRAAAARAGAPRARNIPLDAASITTMDPPEHTRLRRIVGGAFSARRLEGMRDRITEVIDGLLDGIAERCAPADLVSDLARPLPMTVVCELLGLPESDRADFHGWTEAYLDAGRASADQARAAARRLDEYCAELISLRGGTRSDDLIGVLTDAHAQDRLTEAELRTFIVTLLVAGYETVAGVLGGSLIVLLRNRDRWNGLWENGRIRPSVIEELLRFTPVAATGGTIRVATEDVELSGTLIRSGSAVLPAIISANRDSRVFTDPDRFVPDREANPHMAFGHGPHRCLGAQLARFQLGAALERLLLRFPDLRAAVPLDELEWDTAKPMRCPKTLPVRW